MRLLYIFFSLLANAADKSQRLHLPISLQNPPPAAAMPAIAKRKSSPPAAGTDLAVSMDLPSEKTGQSNGDCTPQKRKLRSDSSPMKASPISTPMKWTSPRRSANAGLNSPENVSSDSNYK